MPPSKRIKVKRLDPNKAFKVKSYNVTTGIRSTSALKLFSNLVEGSEPISDSISKSDSADTSASVTEDTEDAGGTVKRNAYREQRMNDIRNWDTQRINFLESYIRSESPSYPPTCVRCETEEGSLHRCVDCSRTALFCEECLEIIHPVQRLHKVELFMDGAFYPSECQFLKELTLHPDATLSATMTMIDSRGRTHSNCNVKYFLDLPTELVSMGYWPTSPKAPSIAVSIELMDMLDALTLDCHISVQGFIKAVDTKNKKVFGSSRLSCIARGECVPEFRVWAQQIKDAPFSFDEEDNQWRTSCPACDKDGSVIISMDANFGLVHKENAGWSYGASPLDDLFFLDQQKVNTFVDEYYPDSKDRNEDCSNFQAANIIRTKNKTVRLDVKGVFGSACRHEVPVKFCDVLHGERLSYPVHMIKEVRKLYPGSSMKFFYDIACMLKSHLKKRGNEIVLESSSICIPIFHSYGHKASCQFTLNPRRIDGYALSDGEQLERLWSYLRPFGRITKEQTPNHRRALLNRGLLHYTSGKVARIEYHLHDRFLRANRMKCTAECKIVESFSNYFGEMSEEERTAKVIDLQMEERAYHESTNIAYPTGQHDWKMVYGRELCTYFALRAKVESAPVSEDDNTVNDVAALERSESKLEVIERKKHIRRWTILNDDYTTIQTKLNTEKRKRLLMKIRNFSVEKEFLRETSRKYSVGQAVAARIFKQVKDVCKKIDNTILMYNRCGIGNTDLPEKIEKSSVYPSSQIFTSFEEEVNGAFQPTVSSSVRHIIVENAAIIERANEEITLLSREIVNVWNFFISMHNRLLSLKEEYKMGITDLDRGRCVLVDRAMLGTEARLNSCHSVLRLHNIQVPDVQLNFAAEGGQEVNVDLGLSECEEELDLDEREEVNELFDQTISSDPVEANTIDYDFDF